MKLSMYGPATLRQERERRKDEQPQKRLSSENEGRGGYEGRRRRLSGLSGMSGRGGEVAGPWRGEARGLWADGPTPQGLRRR